LSIAALEAGKHVICEKPLAPTPAEVQKMIAARDKSGKLLMTAQHFRFQGNAQAMKAEIDGGALGDVYHARSWMLRRTWAPTGRGFIMKQNSGGGPCIDIGVHILDLTLWMMGHPKAVAVTGVTQDKLAKLPGAFSTWGGAIPKEFDVEEFAAAFVRFEKRRDSHPRGVVAAASQNRRRRHANVAVWHQGRRAVAEQRTDVVAQRNTTSSRHAVEASCQSRRTARARVHGVRQGHS
jgi:predicted dehydrogenase